MSSVEALGGRFGVVRRAYKEAMEGCLPSDTPWLPYQPTHTLNPAASSSLAYTVSIGPAPVDIFLDSGVEELSDPVMIALGEGEGLGIGGMVRVHGWS
jgi:hypothetical protein